MKGNYRFCNWKKAMLYFGLLPQTMQLKENWCICISQVSLQLRNPKLGFIGKISITWEYISYFLSYSVFKSLFLCVLLLAWKQYWGLTIKKRKECESVVFCYEELPFPHSCCTAENHHTVRVERIRKKCLWLVNVIREVNKRHLMVFTWSCDEGHLTN